MFARSLGDPNPIYSDPEYAAAGELGTVIAPPTFVQSGFHFDADFDRRPKIGEPWFGSGREAIGATTGPQPREGQSGFHAEQQFEYHRNLKPGDILRAETRPGRSWEKTGKRGGKLVFTESVTEYCDQQGQLVITARSVSVLTERLVTGAIDAGDGDGA